MAYGSTADNCDPYVGMALPCKEEPYNLLVQLALAPAQMAALPPTTSGAMAWRYIVHTKRAACWRWWPYGGTAGRLSSARWQGTDPQVEM